MIKDTKLDTDCDMRKLRFNIQATFIHLVEITRCQQPVTTSPKYQIYIEITIQ